MSPLRSWQRDLDVADYAADMAKTEHLTTFVRDCIAGAVPLCRVPSTADTPDAYAAAVAVAYDADQLDLTPMTDLALLKRIARDEFSAWRRTAKAEQRDTAERLHNPLLRFGGVR
jgi:hypothetical protein